MPRRYYDYPEQFQPLNVISTVGSWALGAVILLAFTCLVLSLCSGRYAPQNPWGSRGFEWLSATPPPPHNYEVTPDFSRREPHDYFRAEP